jgi:putative N6-adenine-specific DNA methylase
VSRRPLQGRSATRSNARAPLDAFAAAAPGLEPIVARELTALGVRPIAEVGGVGFRASLDMVASANCWLRVASRVLVRVASFRAQAFHELERLARAVPWETYLGPRATVRFRVTSKKSRLYHTGGIAQRFGEAIEHRLGVGVAIESAGNDETETSSSTRAQLFVIRAFHDDFTVSADSSGSLLHQRGYRKAVAKAPLRETLAASLLYVADWTGNRPLVDPFCGSGTIPIEAALLARRIAPGLHRSFAFQSWPGFDRAMWDRVRANAAEMILPACPSTIVGSDRDAGAIDAAIANAERAGVRDDIRFDVRALSAIDDAADALGDIVTNPPYGVRVGEATRLRDLYARFGQVLRARYPSWRLTMLSANERLERELRLRLQEVLHTRNGGIAVGVMTGTVPDREVEATT